MKNALSAPKTATYHFRINPEVKNEVESIYAKSGITLTQAINIFLQQTLNAGGFPFQVSGDNAEYIKSKAMEKLMQALDEGKESGELVSEADVYKRLGVDIESTAGYMEHELGNENAARKFRTRILQGISLLKKQPMMGMLLKERFDEIETEIRFFIMDKQIIFYEVNAAIEQIEVIRVLDSRTDYLALLFSQD